jgi:hypothetical protein
MWKTPPPRQQLAVGQFSQESSAQMSPSLGRPLLQGPHCCPSPSLSTAESPSPHCWDNVHSSLGCGVQGGAKIGLMPAPLMEPDIIPGEPKTAVTVCICMTMGQFGLVFSVVHTRTTPAGLCLVFSCLVYLPLVVIRGVGAYRTPVTFGFKFHHHPPS